MKMLILLSLATLSVTAYAEEKTEEDPFDLSESVSKVEELGVITKPQADILEERAKELFNAGNCEESIPVLIEYEKEI